jgi:5,10-methylene-tetrahydrofolate dehydrogenase/methenyl tetrahydrofolate cyclohydrolase
MSARLLEAMADLVATVVPALERLGIATAAEIGIATLAERMKREVAANNCLIIGRSEVGAWARV